MITVTTFPEMKKNVPDCGHCVQSITLQPDSLAFNLIKGDVKDPTVVPVGITNPLIAPIIPAICTEMMGENHAVSLI